MMRRGIVATLGITLVGCQATPSKVTGDAPTPAGTAIIREADNVVVHDINGKAIRKPFTLFPTLQPAPRYEVPAGPCTLVVRFESPHAGSNFTGVPKTLTFTALPGRAYTLNSRVALFHGGSLGKDEWDARIVDDAAKGVFVAQTTDMKP